jgi:uncharacterized membrane protein YbaN (DUF454 family)
MSQNDPKNQKNTKRKKIINAVLVAVGSLSLGIGAVGVVVPVLPTFPFLLLTLICYTKGSVKFERWFKSTKLYHKSLEPFIKTKAMTNANKVKVLLLITALISIPIILVDVLPMRIVLAAVILMHYYIFIFRIKSVSKTELAERLAKIRAEEAEKENIKADNIENDIAENDDIKADNNKSNITENDYIKADNNKRNIIENGNIKADNIGNNIAEKDNIETNNLENNIAENDDIKANNIENNISENEKTNL